MIKLSLIFLVFVCIQIITNSIGVKKADAYIKDIENEISEELKIIK